MGFLEFCSLFKPALWTGDAAALRGGSACINDAGRRFVPLPLPTKQRVKMAAAGAPPRRAGHFSISSASTTSTPCIWPSRPSNQGLCELPTMDSTRPPGLLLKATRIFATMRRLRASQPDT